MADDEGAAVCPRLLQGMILRTYMCYTWIWRRCCGRSRACGCCGRQRSEIPPREQIERLRQLAGDANLDPDFAEKFLNFIVKEVIRHHEAIAAEAGN